MTIPVFLASACAARLVLIGPGHDLSRSDRRIGNQVSVAIKSFGLQLVTNLEKGSLRNGAIFRPHVDGVPAGVAEVGGELDSRAEEVDGLLSCDHAAMLNAFSYPMQAHLAGNSLKSFT